METFLVRIWVPSDGNDNGNNDGPHGFLEHPLSEQSWKFAGAEDLCRQLELAIAETLDQRDLLKSGGADEPAH